MPGDTTVNGPQGSNGDNYLWGHTQIDSQVGYTLQLGFKLTASGLSLKNKVFSSYQGSAESSILREYYHPTYSFALKWTSSSEP